MFDSVSLPRPRKARNAELRFSWSDSNILGGQYKVIPYRNGQQATLAMRSVANISRRPRWVC